VRMKRINEEDFIKRRIEYCVESSFSAAHHIEDHPKCGKTHGHNYKVKLIVSVDAFLDLGLLKTMLDNILKHFDHIDLGHCLAEDIAKHIVLEVKDKLVSYNVFEIVALVSETESLSVAYRWLS